MAATTAHSRILEIPLGNEFIPVDLDDLPADLGDVVELLTEERPPTHIWTRLATQCWSQNRWTEAEDIIRKGCDAFNSQPETCLPLYNMLAAFQVAKARQAPKTILPDARESILRFRTSCHSC